MVEVQNNVVVLEVKKSNAGTQIHMDRKCILKDAKGFVVGEQMLLNTNAGKVMAVKGNKGWSIDKQTCRKYTENLSQLIS